MQRQQCFYCVILALCWLRHNTLVMDPSGYNIIMFRKLRVAFPPSNNLPWLATVATAPYYRYLLHYALSLMQNTISLMQATFFHFGINKGCILFHRFINELIHLSVK